MGSCTRRHFLLSTCFLQLMTIIERQVFDFLGFMWGPILANFFHIIFVIFGFYGAYHFRVKYIIAYLIWNFIWIGWNAFIICFYLDIGELDKKSDILNLGTGDFSWFEINGYGCKPFFPENFTSEESYRPLRPERVDDCLLDYTIIEVIHSGVQCVLSVFGILGAILIAYIFIDEDDQFDFMGGDAKSPQHTSVHPMYVSYTSIPTSASATMLSINKHNNNNLNSLNKQLIPINNNKDDSLKISVKNQNFNNYNAADCFNKKPKLKYSNSYSSSNNNLDDEILNNTISNSNNNNSNSLNNTYSNNKSISLSRASTVSLHNSNNNNNNNNSLQTRQHQQQQQLTPIHQSQLQPQQQNFRNFNNQSTYQFNNSLTNSNNRNKNPSYNNYMHRPDIKYTQIQNQDQSITASQIHNDDTINNSCAIQSHSPITTNIINGTSSNAITSRQSSITNSNLDDTNDNFALQTFTNISRSNIKSNESTYVPFQKPVPIGSHIGKNIVTVPSPVMQTKLHQNNVNEINYRHHNQKQKDSQHHMLTPKTILNPLDENHCDQSDTTEDDDYSHINTNYSIIPSIHGYNNLNQNNYPSNGQSNIHRLHYIRPAPLPPMPSNGFQISNRTAVNSINIPSNSIQHSFYYPQQQQISQQQPNFTNYHHQQIQPNLQYHIPQYSRQPNIQRSGQPPYPDLSPEVTEKYSMPQQFASNNHDNHVNRSPVPNRITAVRRRHNNIPPNSNGGNFCDQIRDTPPGYLNEMNPITNSFISRTKSHDRIANRLRRNNSNNQPYNNRPRPRSYCNNMPSHDTNAILTEEP